MLTGISPKTVIAPSLPCMSDTILHTNMQTGGCAVCSRGRVKKSSCEPEPETPDLFGEASSAIGSSRGSVAPSSATKARSYRPSLSDRLTLSLIRSGLVAGITPTSIRRRSRAEIRDSAFWPQGGHDVASLEAANSSSSAGDDALAARDKAAAQADYGARIIVALGVSQTQSAKEKAND